MARASIMKGEFEKIARDFGDYFFLFKFEEELFGEMYKPQMQKKT